MTSEVFSLLALLSIIVAGCFSRINLGVLSLVLAFLLGLSFGELTAVEVYDLFPARLLLRVAGIMLLFSQATVNGTLARVAGLSVRALGASPVLVPWLYFLLAFCLAASGAGNLAATVIFAPLALKSAHEAHVPAKLMIPLLAFGASAGALSPIAPTGVVATDLFLEMGIPPGGWRLFLYSAAAHGLAAILAFLVFGGLRLLREAPPAAPVARDTSPPGWNWEQKLTLLVLGAFVVAAAAFRVEIGLAAFAAAALLALLRAADDAAAIREVPWSVLLLVCGVMTLAGVVSRTGGIVLFTRLVATVSDPAYLPGIMAAISGAVSIYASSIGIVLPAFLPAAPGLASATGAEVLAVAYSISIGAHLVDVAPLSPIGAISVGYALPVGGRPRLFRQMLALAWAMTAVAFLVCQLFFG